MGRDPLEIREDIALAGRIIASHYARPLMRSCGAHAAFVRRDPDADAAAASELLPGEDFAVLEYAGGWAWGYCAADHVVGYVEAIGLADPRTPTHIVCERCAPVAADEGIMSPVLASLPMGTRLHGEEHGACLTTEYGCVSLSHLLFQEAGMPALAMGGYDYPHRYTLDDTVDKLSVVALERIGRTLKSWLERRAPF